MGQCIGHTLIVLNVNVKFNLIYRDMINEKLNDLIKEAMLNHDYTRLEVVRSIKAMFTNFEKEGKTLTEADETKLLLKMVSQREDSITQYFKAGRQDLVDKETAELAILKEYTPVQASDDEIAEYTKEVCQRFVQENGSVAMKDMKTILATVQEKYSTANGKVVSSVVKEYGK